MSVGKSDYLSRLQTLLVFLICNGTVKTKLAALVFLYCGEIVKYSIVLGDYNYSNSVEFPNDICR